MVSCCGMQLRTDIVQLLFSAFPPYSITFMAQNLLKIKVSKIRIGVSFMGKFWLSEASKVSFMLRYATSTVFHILGNLKIYFIRKALCKNFVQNDANIWFFSQKYVDIKSFECVKTWFCQIKKISKNTIIMWMEKSTNPLTLW